MSLTPKNESELLDAYLERQEDEAQPSLTYALNFDTGRIGGLIDGKEAVRQFIRKAIITTRGRWRIYSDDYGCELPDLIGAGVTAAYIESDAPRMVSEAIEYDDRIVAINEITANMRGDSVFIVCDVTSIYGDVIIEAVI